MHGASPAHSFTWFRLVCYQSSTEVPARPQTSSLPLQPAGNCPQGTRMGIVPPEEEQERCSLPLPAHLHLSASWASHPHGAGAAVRSLLCQGAGKRQGCVPPGLPGVPLPPPAWPGGPGLIPTHQGNATASTTKRDL